MIGGADFLSRGSERSSIVVSEPSHLSLPLFYWSLRALFIVIASLLHPSLRAKRGNLRKAKRKIRKVFTF